MDVGNYDLNIRMSPNSSEMQISLIDPKGVVSQKTVSVDDLVIQLASSHRISTGVLPRGTRLYKGTSSDYNIVIELVPKKRSMIIGNPDNDDSRIRLLPVPRCLFTAHVKSNRIYDTGMFCLTSSLVNWTDQLYSFPYGNIYQEGKICWGEAALPNIRRPMDIVSVLAIFFDSGFNGDLMGEGAFIYPSVGVDEDPIDNLWSLCKYVENMDEFPEELMNKKSFTLSEFIEGSVG